MAQATPLNESDDLVLARLQKLERLRQMGVDPYPRRFERTHLSREVVERFDELEGQTVRVAGRIVGGIRHLGKAAFAHILDAAGRLQIHFRQDLLGERAYDIFLHCDAGDFIGVEGRVFRTRRGEVTVEAHKLVFLAKALRPMPEKWHGLVEVEKRYRRRYLDLIANEETRRTFQVRSRLIMAMRRYLTDRGFVEVETPVLQPVPGGGAARPFETYFNALDRTLYLRIALELYLKRCLIGGIEKVFEIGRNFRNEGLSTKHNPEFTMVEIYQAYADYRDVMDLVEDMIVTLAREVLGSTTLTYNGHTVDLTPPWPRIRLQEAIRAHAGVDYGAYASAEDLRKAAAAVGLHPEPGWSRGKVIDELLSVFVEPRLVQPTFLVDYPVELSPLAKRRPENPEEVERFELFIGGMEIANAFSELNDPLDQRQRFEEQRRLRLAGDEEAQPFDEDFLEALEHGMPPAGGLGVGVDRLTMLFTDKTSIREVILFPQLRTLD